MATVGNSKTKPTNKKITTTTDTKIKKSAGKKDAVKTTKKPKTTKEQRARKTPITIDTPLTEKERKFCEQYIIHGVAYKAVKEAGYNFKSAPYFNSQGTMLLKKPNIIHYLNQLREEQRKKHIATADEVMQYFTQVMNGEIKDQFQLDASIRDRNDAAKEIAKRTIDIDNRLKGIADQKVDNEVKITLDWSRKEVGNE